MNQRENAGNLIGNGKNVENQGGDAANEGGNLNMAVEMTQNNNGNDKFKEQREAKIVENEHICKNAVSQIRLVPFLLTLGIFRTIVFLLLLILNR